MERILLSLLTLLFFSSVAMAQTEHSVLKLAVVAPVSGIWGNYGNEIVRGAELAVASLKGEYGPLELKVEDACLATDTVKAAAKLAEIDKVKAVVGSYCVVGMVPMAGILEKHQIIGFHSSAVADEILDSGDYIFTTNVTIADEAKALARYAYNQLGARRVGILFLLTQWGLNYSKYFSEEFVSLGGKVTESLESQVGVMDFRTEILRVAKTKPDVLFVAHVGTELGTVMRQARQAGLQVPILGPHESEEQGVIDVAKKDAEGLTFLSPKLPKSGAQVERFQGEYKRKFGSEPGILAANAYDATNIAVRTLRDCNLEPSCAKARIYRTKDYPGVSGTFSITPSGGTSKEFVRKMVVDGRFKEVP